MRLDIMTVIGLTIMVSSFLLSQADGSCLYNWLQLKQEDRIGGLLCQYLQVLELQLLHL